MGVKRHRRPPETAAKSAQREGVLDPEDGGEDGPEGDEGRRHANAVAIAGENIIPVLETQVEELEEEPGRRRPEEEEGEGRAAAGDEGAPLDPANDAVESEDETAPGKEVKVGGERLHLPQGEGEAGGDEGGAKQEKGQHSHPRSRVQATVGGGRGWPPSLLWVRSDP